MVVKSKEYVLNSKREDFVQKDLSVHINILTQKDQLRQILYQPLNHQCKAKAKAKAELEAAHRDIVICGGIMDFVRKVIYAPTNTIYQKIQMLNNFVLQPQQKQPC